MLKLGNFVTKGQCSLVETRQAAFSKIKKKLLEVLVKEVIAITIAHAWAWQMKL